MWILLSAIVTASVLGSLHCVGMCGPLAIWASSAESQRSSRQIFLSTSLYHLGRLLTYMVAGCLAGMVGSLVDQGGQMLGFQLAAARVVGSVMMVLGGIRLWRWFHVPGATNANLKPSRIGKLLAQLRPFVFRLPVAGRALATGMLTTLLPCGWLYLFALAAAGTGSMLMGPIVMAAFWVGTVPALVALVAGTRVLSTKLTTLVPVATAILLVTTGFYTASGRGFAKIRSLTDIAPADRFSFTFDQGDSVAGSLDGDVIDDLNNLLTAPLPCCDPLEEE